MLSKYPWNDMQISLLIHIIKRKFASPCEKINYTMAMNKYSNVEEFLADQDSAKKEQIERLRAIIKKAKPELTEHIKWNAPSFVLDGEDRITFNVLNKDGAVNLILHMGATRKEDKKGAPVMPDDKGLVSWQSDIRGMMSFADVASIEAKEADIADVISRWL